MMVKESLGNYLICPKCGCKNNLGSYYCEKCKTQILYSYKSINEDIKGINTK